MSHDQEILGPQLTTRAEARPLIDTAVKHFSTARRATIQVMADLRRLQDGQVHLLYGYKNFAQWAGDTFEGLNTSSVRQLCRAGAVALELDRRKLIDLHNPKGVGTTGLRELSTVAGTYGNDKMAEVFITARDLLDNDRFVSGVAVEAAMRLLMPPAEPMPEPSREAMEKTDIGEDDEPETEYSDKVNELMDRIRDLSWDLPESANELQEATMQLKAQLRNENTDTDQTWSEGAR